jgi:predicted ATPase/DNA-binding CsgD family transcriptional regulator
VPEADQSRQVLEIVPQRRDEPARTSESNLPARLTSLIGREREADAVRGILQRPDVRLVTLTGPGGVGKTHLGLRIAGDLIAEFADGVRFVSLAPIRDPDLVVPAIAQTLGLREAGERPLLERLKSHLRDKRLLLLLDNFEQVTEAAPVVAELLKSCASLKALVTSRETLRLSGEQEFPLPPLELPDPNRPPGTEARYDAVELFVERARAVKPDFRLTGENAPLVAEICVRLDGLPLAIELAAARIKLLPPRKMLRRLEHRLRLLTTGARDAPARQKTLEKTMEWSYDLLNADEQLSFRRLAVFSGGCSLEAAEWVVGEPGGDTLGMLAALIDKNLLRQAEGDDGEARLMMLETIREYAIKRLSSSGEEESIRRAHAEYYLALAEEAGPGLTTAGQVKWLNLLDAEHDNLRAALQWALERNEAETGLRLGRALWRFWYLRCYLSEGQRWLEETLALSGGSPILRAGVLSGAGHIAWGRGDFERAATLREESLKLFRQLGDKAGIAASLNGLSFVSRMRGDYAAAREMCSEALVIYRELDDRWGIAQSLFLSGATAAFQGDHEAGRPLLEESVALYREVGEGQGLADALGVLGMSALSREDYGAVRPLLEECRKIVQSVGYRRGLAKTSSCLGDLVLNQGDPGKAHALYTEGLEILKELDDKWWMAWCLEGLAGVAAAQGQPERAARIFGATETLREEIKGPRPAAHRADYERMVAAARSRLDNETFAAAWEEGRAMTPEQALASDEPALRQTGKEPSRPAGLTIREVEVLGLVARGMNNARVAEELFVSPRTVDAHLRSIYEKLGVSSRTAAAHYATDHELL